MLRGGGYIDVAQKLPQHLARVRWIVHSHLFS
jgi:hypothetical protein